MKLCIILSESHSCILDPWALSHIPWPLQKLLPYHFSELLAYFFTYLSGPCLSCGMQDPQSLLWHMGVFGSWSCSMQTLSCCMWDPITRRGVTPPHPHWKCRTLVPGQSGNSIVTTHSTRKILQIKCRQSKKNKLIIKYYNVKPNKYFLKNIKPSIIQW